MSYKHYKIEDFLSDPNFKNWVVNPTHHSTQYWESVGMNDKELQDKMRKARRVILKLDFSFDDPTEEEIKESLNRVLHASPNKFDNNKIQVVKKRNWITIGIAASLFLAVAFSFFIQRAVLEVEPSIRIVKKENPRGQKSTIMLPDGTKVILNAESTISYKSSFDSNERKVVLHGEAFFDVTRDPQRPFMVETKNLVTTALGTSFNVNAYKDQEEHVTLLTGKVSVNQLDRRHYEILNPGERADFRDGLITKYKDASLNDVKWKDGILLFQKTPFEEGIIELERWYGVSIEVQNYPENTSKNFTGIFENDNLSNVLESLGYAMRFDYKINDKSIIITFK
tara:strand:- start:931 stop:1947 length:1017 start_codon:yes stop_codon:yes gene_type:complete